MPTLADDIAAGEFKPNGYTPADIAEFQASENPGFKPADFMALGRKYFIHLVIAGAVIYLVAKGK